MSFARYDPAEQAARRRDERKRTMRALCTPTRSLNKGVMAGSSSGVAIEKPQAARPGKRKPTNEERAWMDWIVSFGCIACRMDGNGIRPAAVHHILRGGRRIGHLWTLPLCDPGHHQGGQPLGMVSRHPWKARFEQKYGSEDHLLSTLKAAYAASRSRA